jgi:hypothetical protein
MLAIAVIAIVHGIRNSTNQSGIARTLNVLKASVIE